MLYTKPYFFDDFKCKADLCSDTCCAGWEVDIDDVTYEKYQSLESVFGKKLIDNIVNQDEYHCFRLDNEDRCIFLKHNGLCEIYSNLGEGYLCDICREHPRFYDFFDCVTEAGLGLCCEKVCELIFSSDDAVMFETCRDDNDDVVNEEDMIYFKIRKTCFDIIVDREKTLEERIKNLLYYSSEIQNQLFSDCYDYNPKKTEDVFDAVIQLFQKTDPINDEWVDYISNLCKNKNEIFSVIDSLPASEIQYEQLLTYIIYRHFMQARFNGNILEMVCFCLVNLVFVVLSDCKSIFDKTTFSLTDRIDNVKRWSKQIEYCQENTDLIIDNAIDILF